MATTAATARGYRTTAEAAAVLGEPAWRLMRWLRLKRVPEPPRVGSMRAWSESDIEAARQALAGQCGREGR